MYAKGCNSIYYYNLFFNNQFIYSIIVFAIAREKGKKMKREDAKKEYWQAVCKLRKLQGQLVHQGVSYKTQRDMRANVLHVEHQISILERIEKKVDYINTRLCQKYGFSKVDYGGVLTGTRFFKP